MTGNPSTLGGHFTRRGPAPGKPVGSADSRQLEGQGRRQWNSEVTGMLLRTRLPWSRSRTVGLLLASLSLVGPGSPAHAISIEKSMMPGESFTLPGFLLSREPLLCQLIPCPQPPLGGEPLEEAETGISLFLPFSEIQVQHPTRSFFFRPGDWKLRLESPNQPNPPFPVDLGEFHEQHVEHGSGVIGDEAGEGIVLYFPLRPDLWSSAQQTGIDLTIQNLTKGTAREGTYLVRGTGRGGLPPVRLCPGKEGDERLDVIVQRSPTGFSTSPFEGATEEVVVLGRRATFHVAVVSQLPADGPGVQGWNLFASLSPNLRLVEVTTAGTVVGGVDLQQSLPAPPDLIHPDTGLPQGEGFVATAIPAADDPPWTLPPVGTATVLRVTVETKDEIPDGGEVTGEVVWRDNMGGEDPETGARTIPWRNNFAVRSRVHYPCTCGSARLVFRSPGFLELLVPPGDEIRVPGVLSGELPGICELIECLEPRFGEPSPNAPREDGFSFFISFSGMQILHPVGIPAFHPGDWELRLEDPRNQLPGFPLVLRDFREDQMDHGSGMIGDEPGEGVVIFFALPPDAADAARDLGLDLALTNFSDAERKRAYLVHVFGAGVLPFFRLCPSGEGQVDVIVQDRLLGSTDVLFAGSTDEVAFGVRPGERGRGSFYPAIVSNFSEPDVGVQGWSLSASVTGDLRVVGGRTVGSALRSLRGGFERFQVVDPTLRHPDTRRRQGEGFVQAIVISSREGLTLPPRGTETVCEVMVETEGPVGEGSTVRGRVEWKDGMTGRGQPVPNIATVLGNSYRFCTCNPVELVFLGTLPDCNSNRLDDDQEIAQGLALDCNRNGIPDACDIEAGTSLDDLDRNGVPDECDCDLRCARVADYFSEPRGVVHEAVLGDVRITEAFDQEGPVPFAVFDCDVEGDGDMELYIPRGSASMSPALLHLDAACRFGAPPRFVSLRLITHDALVIGYDALGRVVSSAAASLPDREQVLTLASSRGIELVEVRGGMTCVIEVCWCCDPVAIPPGRFRRADANRDGKTDISDAVSTLGFLFLGAPGPSCPDAADANDDGRLDISDPVSTLNFLFLGTSPPPDPGPADCGKDPTPSQLGACTDEVCS